MFSCINLLFKKKTIKINNYSNYDLNNIGGKFYVESVYDGDTISILVPMKISIYDMVEHDKINIRSDTNPTNKIVLNKIRVRLYGIDAPELKPSKNMPNRNEHIAKAKKSKDFLSNLILNKIVKVNFLSNDKYGRPLVKLYIDDADIKNIYINDLIIEKGYAVEYYGKTKNNII